MLKLPLLSFVFSILSFFFLLVYLLLSIGIQKMSFVLLSIFVGVFVISCILFLVSLLFIQKKKQKEYVSYKKDTNILITVALTAYNDELSIAEAVLDFKKHPLVKRVIVINNNSTDNTFEKAEGAGAIVYNEEKQGYGACVYRALIEGCKFEDTELTLLCEGDMTFRAYDIDKFLAYLPHADIVAGTRIVDQLRNKKTQLSSFMFYGNFFVGKMLELKHLSKGTFTDVGATYKLCRNKILKDLLPKLDNSINLEFNTYFLDIALQNNINIVECPITFHQRIGKSKGGNINNLVAFKLGLRMLKGLLFKWKTKI